MSLSVFAFLFAEVVECLGVKVKSGNGCLAGKSTMNVDVCPIENGEFEPLTVCSFAEG